MSSESLKTFTKFLENFVFARFSHGGGHFECRNDVVLTKQPPLLCRYYSTWRELEIGDFALHSDTVEGRKEKKWIGEAKLKLSKFKGMQN
jgi:hypothetical protein